MIERAYTVKEIDELRQAVYNRFVVGRYDATDDEFYEYVNIVKAIKSSDIEERVRTFMMAGLTAKDLHESRFK